MGQLLSQPVTEKHIKHMKYPHLAYTIGEMQGYRLTMEDAHCEFIEKLTINEDQLKVDVKHDEEVSTSEVALARRTNQKDQEILINIFGVFDGHGGSSVSSYISKKLPEIILKNVNAELSKKDFDPGRDVIKQIELAQILKRSFLECDEELYARSEKSGSTAIIAVLINDQCIVANTGDSRCIISINGTAKTMSYDHKPGNYGELLRIHQDGGYVSYNRVNGILALSRAFGDFSFKNDKQMERRTDNKNQKPPEEFQVSVDPEIMIHRMNYDNDEFIVLACDGIWDCFKNKDLIVLIRNLLSLGKTLNEITEVILDECLKMANTVTGVGFDNMTLNILALFKQGEDIDQWHARIKNKILDQKFGKEGH